MFLQIRCDEDHTNPMGNIEAIVNQAARTVDPQKSVWVSIVSDSYQSAHGGEIRTQADLRDYVNEMNQEHWYPLYNQSLVWDPTVNLYVWK